MHEQWKKRKMFSNREQGIMSGLDPVPMMAGGSVPYPGMEMGGIVSHSHPELHSHGSSKIDPGFIREFAPKMEVGGVVPQTQLFEEGDNELNASLNMMASVSNPDVPDMPMPMMDEKVEVREEATMDQGPDGFRMAVDDLKATFKSEIDNYVSQGQTKNLGKYLQDMNIVYTNELKKLKSKYDVTIDSPEDQLFTDEFLSEVMPNSEIPGMKNGGLFELVNEIDSQEELDKYGIQYPLDVWMRMKEEPKEVLLLASIAQMNAAGSVETTPQVDLSKLEALQAERRGLSKKAGSVAGSAYSSTGSDIGELIGKVNAAKAAELSTMDTALADEIAVAKSLANAQTKTSTSGGKITYPADTLNKIFGATGEDSLDLSKQFFDAVDEKQGLSDDPMAEAIVDFADFGELPYLNAYTGKKLLGNTPVDWLTYYKAQLNQQKNNLGNKFPTRKSNQDGYYEITIQIVNDWKNLKDV